MTRIVVAEALEPSPAGPLQPVGPVLADGTLWNDRGRLLAEMADCEALLVRNQTQVDRELIDAAPRLRAVGRWGVGLDNLDVPALRERGVEVITGGAANATSVAEYVLAAMLIGARHLAEADVSVRRSEWARARFGGIELAGKTLGLVGLGEIGRRVAVRARAFEMRVVAYDPFLTPEHPLVQAAGATLVPLDDLLAEADVVSLHVPLTDTTRGMLDAARLRAMKPKAQLINTARGGIVDEAALLAHLRATPAFYAVLDVRDVEPSPTDDPFKDVPNVLLTPHVAGLSAEAQAGIAANVVAGVLRVLQS